MSKFKVGDRVHYSNEYNDLTGTLVRLDDAGDWVLRVDNKDYVGWYDDDTESSNCRWIFDGLDTCCLSHITSISPNDTVRLKSGEPFTTGSYTAEVDSTKGDIVLLKHGSWLPVEAVEKVEALTVEVGKTYEAANGQAVSISSELGDGFIRELGDKFVWEHDGSCRYAAGCTTEPWRLLRDVPAAEPAAETKPKFKVGDRVRVNYGDKTWDSTIVAPKDHGFVVSRDNGGWPAKEYGNGLYWFVQELDLSPLTELPEATYAGKILSLEEDGRGLKVTLSVDTSSLQADLADQFQRIADALRAA